MKRGQVSIPFHWIYILIAGAIILIFFIGIVVRQKDVSNRELAITVSQKLDNILVAASQSDQTSLPVNFAELEITFSCDEDGTSVYKIGDAPPKISGVQPIFAPHKIKTTQLDLWAVEFNMPFKIINLLLLSSPDIETFLIYDEQDSSSQNFMEKITEELPNRFNFQPVTFTQFYSDQLPDVGKFAKLIFLKQPINQDLPKTIARLNDDDVSALHALSNQQLVTYYKKVGKQLFVEEPTVDTVTIMDTFDAKNAAFYAALFSDNGITFRCSMGKAFTRLNLLSEVYTNRTKLIKNDYPTSDPCHFTANVVIFEQFMQESKDCSPLYQNSCAALFAKAATIKQMNTAMHNNLCAVLY